MLNSMDVLTKPIESIVLLKPVHFFFFDYVEECLILLYFIIFYFMSVSQSTLKEGACSGSLWPCQSGLWDCLVKLAKFGF